MKINISRLMDFITETNGNTADYYKSSNDYYKEHGHGVNLDRAKTKEEKHIVWAHNSFYASKDVESALMEVLDLDDEQRARTYAAARALTRWYNDTKWERLPSSDLLERIWKYIQG